VSAERYFIQKYHMVAIGFELCMNFIRIVKKKRRGLTHTHIDKYLLGDWTFLSPGHLDVIYFAVSL